MVGHYVKCRLKRKKSLNCVDQPCLASTTALRFSFSEHVLAEIIVNSMSGLTLVDTGSTNSYLSKEFGKINKLPYKTIKYFPNMADISLKTEICGVSYSDLTFLEHHYKNSKYYVMSNRIPDSIIGDDLLQQHKSVTFEFRGKKKELYISIIMPTARVPYPNLLRNITRNCKPIGIKARKFSTSSDQALIKAETNRLLNEN